MATATEDGPSTTPEPDGGAAGHGSEHRCECGHVLRVFGTGRHRVYFDPENAALDDPVMDRVCPGCGRALPGKN